MSAWSVSHCLSVSVFLVGHLIFIWVLSEKGPTDVFLNCRPVFLNSPIQRDWSLSANLYHLSVWTELACLLASIFLVSSIGVCLKCFPLLVCQCLSSGPLDFYLGSFWKRANRCLSKLSPSVSEQSYSKGLKSFCQSVSLVCLDWTRVSSCQYLSSEFNRCLLEVFPTACLSVSF